MYHVPFYFVASGYPVVFIYRLVALYSHEILACGGEVTVHLCGGHLYGLIGCKTRSGLAHGGKHGRKRTVKFSLVDIEDIFLAGIDIIP